jgi:hypothetical protein
VRRDEVAIGTIEKSKTPEDRMLIEYDVDSTVAYVRARMLEMVTDEAKRADYDRFVNNAVFVLGVAMRDQIEKLIDEINGAMGEDYIVRLVHEDAQDFVEIKPITRGGE